MFFGGASATSLESGHDFVRVNEPAPSDKNRRNSTGMGGAATAARDHVRTEIGHNSIGVVISLLDTQQSQARRGASPS